MRGKLTGEWFLAALIRVARTVAQTALAMITVGAAFSDIDWLQVLSISLVAGLASLLTSVATNLPEVGTDGVLLIDKSQTDKDVYQIVLNDPIETIDTTKNVKLKIEPNADLSQEKPPI